MHRIKSLLVYTEKQEKVFVLVRQAALATNDKFDSTILLDTLFDKLRNKVSYDLSRLELVENSYNNKSCQVLNRQYVNYRLPTNLMVFSSF